jgi:predicted lipoprotein
MAAERFVSWSCLVALAVTLITTFGCSAGQPENVRQRVVNHLAVEVVVPAYEQLAVDAAELASLSKALCAETVLVERLASPELQRAQEGWRAAFDSWQRARMVDFGPIDQRRSMSVIDWQPFDAERLGLLMSERSESGTLDSVSVRERWPSGARGLSAVEWLLFEKAGQERLVRDRAGCEMLVAASRVIADEAAALASAWTGDGVGSAAGGAYVDRLTGSATVSLDAHESTSRFVRAIVFALQARLDGERIELDSGTPDSSRMELSHGRTSGFAQEVTMIRDLYLGVAKGQDSGFGLTRLVSALSEPSDQRMRQALENAEQAALAFERLEQGEGLDAETSLHALYQALEEVQRLMVTDVTSLLGVSIGFSDNDGDTG